ncbi:hypothetical protein B296_00017498 [Ensete ventricosum]|uniref:Uncharacterized protein n=1 Tax=Ensete ventricosum TaxID=4639 RepID=A0A426YB56_ENSVE|nr:hypothetical protein B296_00017498 [Ensete ventricosum]
MLGRSQVRALGPSSDDVVGSLSRTHQKFAGKFIESLSIGCRELVGCSSKEWWKFVGSSWKEIESSLRTHQKFAGKFVGSSSTGCREFAGSSPEECWEFNGSSLKEIGSSLGVHQNDAGSSPRDNQTMKIVCWES